MSAVVAVTVMHVLMSGTRGSGVLSSTGDVLHITF